MTVIPLVARSKGKNSDSGALNDPLLETGAITIEEAGYTTAIDRIYDVKGLANMHVEIENTGGSNGLTYKIEKARKEFVEVSELANADFDEDIKGDTNVAFGAISISDIIDLSPESTAIRIRIKEQVGGSDTTLAGIVSVN